MPASHSVCHELQKHVSFKFCGLFLKNDQSLSYNLCIIPRVWDTVGLYTVTITVNTYTIFINFSSRIQCIMQVVINGQNTICWPGLALNAVLRT